MARPTKVSTLEATLKILKLYGVHKAKLESGMEVEFRLPGFDGGDLPKMTIADLNDDDIRRQAIRETISQAKASQKEHDDILYHST